MSMTSIIFGQSAALEPRRSLSRLGSSSPLPPSPPGEKATARQDQAGQASTDDGTGDSGACARNGVVETEPFRKAAHRFTKCNLNTVRACQQWDANQVV